MCAIHERFGFDVMSDVTVTIDIDGIGFWIVLSILGTLGPLYQVLYYYSRTARSSNAQNAKEQETPRPWSNS